MTYYAEQSCTAGSLNAAGINYQTLKAAAALKCLHELESISLPESRFGLAAATFALD